MLGKMVVGPLRDPLRLIDIEQRLDARRGERQDRDVDAGLVHVADPLLAQVEQPVDDLRRALGRAGRVETP